MSLKLSGEKSLRQKVAALTQNLAKSDRVALELARTALEGIKQRTLSGRDRYNRPFIRDKKGHLPDLKASGAMLAAMVVQKNGEGATIVFNNSKEEEIAQYHQYGTAQMPARPFFGLDPGQVRSILANWLRYLS